MKLIGWNNFDGVDASERLKQHFVVLSRYKNEHWSDSLGQREREPEFVTLCGSPYPDTKPCTMRLTFDPKVDCKMCAKRLRELMSQLLTCEECGAGAAIILCGACRHSAGRRANDSLIWGPITEIPTEELLREVKRRDPSDEVLRVRGDIPRHEEAP